MSEPALAAVHAVSLGSSAGSFPTATQWLSFIAGAEAGLTITTLGGQTVSIGNLPSGIYPIRATAVTAVGGCSAIVGWW
jgi:hypothetical protein